MARLQETLEQLQNFDINELDVNNIGVWPEPVKWIVIVLVLVLTVGAGYWFWLSTKLEALDDVVAEEQTLRSSYEEKAFAAANLGALRRQQEQMEATFGALLRQLPSDTEVPGLLEDITLTALDNGLKIQAIELEPERTAEIYVELPITVTVEGNFHQMGSFVSGVASLPRIVTLHDFTIRPVDGPSHLTMTILAKTYRYLDAS